MKDRDNGIKMGDKETFRNIQTVLQWGSAVYRTEQETTHRLAVQTCCRPDINICNLYSRTVKITSLCAS